MKKFRLTRRDLPGKISLAPANGEVSEWFMVPVLKTGVPKGTVGSNPTFSAPPSERGENRIWFS